MNGRHGKDVLRLPVSKCLECGKTLDAIGTGDRSRKAEIEPGDFALCVCIRCGAVMALDEHRKLRGMTDEEIDGLMADRKTMDEIAKLTLGIHLLRHSQG